MDQTIRPSSRSIICRIIRYRLIESTIDSPYCVHESINGPVCSWLTGFLRQGWLVSRVHGTSDHLTQLRNNYHFFKMAHISNNP